MKEFMNHNFTIDKILLCCYVPAGSGDAVHRNRPSHGLAFHTGGTRFYHFKTGEACSVSKNEIIYMPKHADYTVRTVTPGDCYAINFDLPTPFVCKPFVTGPADAARLLEHFKKAQLVWRKKDAGYELKCKAELYNILYYLVHGASADYLPNRKIEMIRPAIDAIHELYTTDALPIPTLAAMCGITPEYFRKLFKSCCGASPAAYINTLRISRAKELLASKLYSVTDAALLSGFNDMSHFSRAFKSAVGIAPSAYKKTGGA